MIDIFTLALTHSLLAVAAWRLLLRDDLDPPARHGRARRAQQAKPADSASDRCDGNA